MNTRDRILDTAISELEAHGLGKLSLREVGRKTGITPMAVYRHFENKDDLLQALGEHAFAVWQQRIAAFDGLSLAAWLPASAKAFIDFALDEPALYSAAFVLKTRAERIYPEDFVAGRAPVVSALARRLQEGQQQGLVRSGDPLELSIGVWGVLQGLVSLHQSGRFNLSRSEFTALCLRSAARLYSHGSTGAPNSTQSNAGM